MLSWRGPSFQFWAFCRETVFHLCKPIYVSTMLRSFRLLFTKTRATLSGNSFRASYGTGVKPRFSQNLGHLVTLFIYFIYLLIYLFKHSRTITAHGEHYSWPQINGYQKNPLIRLWAWSVQWPVSRSPGKFSGPKWNIQIKI